MPNQFLNITNKYYCFLFTLITYSFFPQSSLAITINTSPNQNLNSSGWHIEYIEHDQLKREFRYYIPEKIAKDPALVILLHGGTQNMMKLFNKNSGGSKEWKNLADQNGFILITPNGTDPKTGSANGKKLNWNDCRHAETTTNRNVNADDIGFIKKLITWSNTKLKSNSKKVYVTGASNGGMMTYRVATELTNDVTAVASFIANLPEDSECKLPIKPIPMLIMNGTNDLFMPWDGGEVKGKGGRVMSTDDTLKFWLLGNNSDQKHPISKTYADINRKDKSNVSSICYPAKMNTKRASKQTCLYKVLGGGHVTPSIKHQTPKWVQRFVIGWQNRDIEGAKIAWEFFKQF